MKRRQRSDHLFEIDVIADDPESEQPSDQSAISGPRRFHSRAPAVAVGAAVVAVFVWSVISVSTGGTPARPPAIKTAQSIPAPLVAAELYNARPGAGTLKRLLQVDEGEWWAAMPRCLLLVHSSILISGAGSRRALRLWR